MFSIMFYICICFIFIINFYIIIFYIINILISIIIIFFSRWYIKNIISFNSSSTKFSWHSSAINIIAFYLFLIRKCNIIFIKIVIINTFWISVVCSFCIISWFCSWIIFFFINFFYWIKLKFFCSICLLICINIIFIIRINVITFFFIYHWLYFIN